MGEDVGKVGDTSLLRLRLRSLRAGLRSCRLEMLVRLGGEAMVSPGGFEVGICFQKVCGSCLCMNSDGMELLCGPPLSDGLKERLNRIFLDCYTAQKWSTPVGDPEKFTP